VATTLRPFQPRGTRVIQAALMLRPPGFAKLLRGLSGGWAGAKYNGGMKRISPTASSLFQLAANGAIQPGDSEDRNEQRDNTRYKCQGHVEFVTENSGVRTFAKLTDISFGGCYVEMTATSAPGAEVHLAIEVSGIRFRVRGIIKTSDPCLGMGIVFTEISALDREYLQDLLLVLSGDMQNERSVAPLPANLNGREAIDSLAHLFATQSFVTRDEFLHIIERFSK
jgi:PilZ domain